MVSQTLLKRTQLTTKQARWADVLREHDSIKIEHCSGASNVVADALSRIDEEEDGDSDARVNVQKSVGDGGLHSTLCTSNVSLHRDVSLHYVAEKPDSGGSVSRGSPGQVEAHTDGNGGRGVNVQKSVGEGGLHRTPCTSNVSLRPGSSNQSVSDSDRSNDGGVRMRPAPSPREALMDGDNQWQEPGFVCAVIPTITAAPSHRNSREEVAQCGGGNWWCQTRFVWM